VESLNGLFRNLGNSLVLEEILGTLDQELRGVIAYLSLAVLLGEDGRFTPAYSTGGDSRAVAWLQGCEGEAAVRQAIEGHRAVLHPLCRDPDGAAFALLFPIEHVPPTAGAAAVLVLFGNEAFSDGDLQVLQELSAKLGASIENARKYRRAEQLAVMDPATGLANVRSLFQRLDAELARARRTRDTLAVLQCSISGFDRSGRICSPEATFSAFEKAALMVRESCREYDFTAKSGDELVVVLPGFRPESLQEKRESVQRIVEEIAVSAGLPLFATVGAAFFPEDGTDAEDLLAAAGQRLILARPDIVSGDDM
jgi:diguanylate cyclase (GGDEF)-like protein